LTLASGGYIITISPMAMGMLVVPDDIEFQKSAMPGESQPQNTPIAMAKKIHNVRYLSKNFSLVFMLIDLKI